LRDTAAGTKNVTVQWLGIFRHGAETHRVTRVCGKKAEPTGAGKEIKGKCRHAAATPGIRRTHAARAPTDRPSGRACDDVSTDVI